MIVGRIGQGFTGGAMIPTAQTIVRTRLPPHQMPIGMTLLSLQYVADLYCLLSGREPPFGIRPAART